MSLIIRNLTVDHGAIRAINNLSFIVEKRRLTAVIGANGAGKSTLLRTLSGLNPATSGKASWGDHNERLKQRADTLSGGERQMLAIGRSLMAKPDLLLLDEPSLGLAPLVVEQIFQTIRDVVNSSSVTVLLVEQNAMGALKIADIGVVLNLGKIAAIGPAADLIADPAIRAAYLGF